MTAKKSREEKAKKAEKKREERYKKDLKTKKGILKLVRKTGEITMTNKQLMEKFDETAYHMNRIVEGMFQGLEIDIKTICQGKGKGNKRMIKEFGYLDCKRDLLLTTKRENVLKFIIQNSKRNGHFSGNQKTIASILGESESTISTIIDFFIKYNFLIKYKNGKEVFFKPTEFAIDTCNNKRRKESERFKGTSFVFC